MTTRDERLSFLEQMQDVRRIRKPNKADVKSPKDLTPGHLERQRSAVDLPMVDRNPLTAEHPGNYGVPA